jgi:hypothetical protein
LNSSSSHKSLVRLKAIVKIPELCIKNLDLTESLKCVSNILLCSDPSLK